MNAITIRDVQMKDLKKVAEISIRGWQKAYSSFVDQDYLDSLSIETRYEKFKQNYQNGPFKVALMNNEVVGFCRYQETVDGSIDCDCELTVLYVQNSVQRQNVGTSLLEYVKKEFKKLNKKKMLIWCFKENLIGKSFYEKNGGKLLYEKKKVIADKSYDEVGYIFDLGD